MPSAISETRMIPASETDNVVPGTFYFGCLNVQRKTDPQSYWIVFRAPREWLPAEFFDIRPVQKRVFPFWIVGKDQRVWLPRCALFYLDRSQSEMFGREERLDFTNTLILINSFQNVGAALFHFKKRILDSTRRHNERRGDVNNNLESSTHSRSPSLLSSTHRSTEDSSATPVIDALNSIPLTQARHHTSPAQEYPSPKRQRREQPVSSHQSPPATAPGIAKSSVAQQAVSNETIDIPNTKIKTEEEEGYLGMSEPIATNDRVRIYVGRNNHEFKGDASVIQKTSPVLYSLIGTDDDHPEKFIMHPRLRNINPHDFMSVLQFIHNGEYDPKMVPNPDGINAGPKGLDECLTVEDYSEELVKGARLYIIAKQFQVKNMTEHIFRKVTQAQYRKYSHVALIEFARIMFNRPDHDNADAAATNGDVVTREPVDAWIVAQLAENFMAIMRSAGQHNRYLELIKNTKHLFLHAVVLEQAAKNYRRIGNLVEVIEDSD